MIYEFKEEGYYYARSINDIIVFIATPYGKVVSAYTKGLKRPLKATKTLTLTIQALTSTVQALSLEFYDYILTISISKPIDVLEITTLEGIYIYNTDSTLIK
jgi:hypothetical protein